MSPPATARKGDTMPTHDIAMARDIGGLQADVRTIKHDVANMNGKIDGLSAQIATINTQQARGLGFFAGVAFILGGTGALLLAFAKLIFGAPQ